MIGAIAGDIIGAVHEFVGTKSTDCKLLIAGSIGGDADTLAGITGAVAEAHYGGVPAPITQRAMDALHTRLRSVVEQFCARFNMVRAG